MHMNARTQDQNRFRSPQWISLLRMIALWIFYALFIRTLGGAGCNRSWAGTTWFCRGDRAQGRAGLIAQASRTWTPLTSSGRGEPPAEVVMLQEEVPKLAHRVQKFTR